MVVIRRDDGIAAASATTAGLSGASIGMLCLGIAALVIASGLCTIFYIQLRKTRAYQAELKLQEKRSQIGKPVLQRAPSDVIEASLDLSRMSNEQRQHFAQRHLQPQLPVRPPMPPQKSSTFTFSLPQSSSGSSGTNSSGPIPTSSSEGTNASSGNKSSEGTSRSYHSASVTPQRPHRSATPPSVPSFAREKRVSRGSVPSALLRGLGDLPQLPAPGSYPKLPVETVQSTTEADNKILEVQTSFSQQPPPIEKQVIAGPSPITVDYFSQTSRRNIAPARSESLKKSKPSSGKHSASSSHSSSNSPYKRPDMDLPPLPTEAKKQQATTAAHDSIFRPLSLGLFLKSSSKSSSLNAATMFGDFSSSFWSEPSDKAAPRSSSPPKEAQEQSISTSSSNDSTILTAMLTESRRGSETSDTTASSANDAYDGASFTKEELQRSQSTRSIHQVKEAKTVQFALDEPREAPPATAYQDGSTFAPFMTPHHRAVYPDQLKGEDDNRSSAVETPDLSQIHSAPLPPATFPVASPTPSKGGFAPSFRAKAKMTLSRARTISTPTQRPVPLANQAVLPEKKSLDVPRTPAFTITPTGKAPVAKVPSYDDAVETWKVDTQEAAPTLVLGLGLGLTDEDGSIMDTNTSLGQERKVLSQPSAFQRHIGNRASSKMSQYTDATLSPLAQHSFRSPMQDEHLGTPPLRQIGSAQYGILSTLSPKLGQTPTMIGNDWMQNRQLGRHAHKSSYASSACDTISSCMTGESSSLYDGGKAYDQRARLLQTIQQGKKVSSIQSPPVDQRGFLSHSARVSAGASAARPITPLKVGNTTIEGQRTPTGPSRTPANLTVETKRGAFLQSDAPNTAPLTPPMTPSEKTCLLATAAPLQDKTPSREEETAARMAKLRPLSLAIQQQKMAASNGSSTSPWNHRSQYSTASTVTAPSASSSTASLYTSPKRISTLATSPSRANFKTSAVYKSAAPLGILPTLCADASPSFLSSTPRLAVTASPRSPRQSIITWSDSVNTPSPRFNNRTSINVNTMRSPLSAFTSPLKLHSK
jgi:hypothetical protein